MCHTFSFGNNRQYFVPLFLLSPWLSRVSDAMTFNLSVIAWYSKCIGFLAPHVHRNSFFLSSDDSGTSSICLQAPRTVSKMRAIAIAACEKESARVALEQLIPLTKLWSPGKTIS